MNNLNLVTERQASPGGNQHQINQEKHKELQMQKAIEKLMNKKIEPEAKSIKLQNSKIETVETLLKIGFPLMRQKREEKLKLFKDQIREEFKQECALYKELAYPVNTKIFIQSCLSQLPEILSDQERSKRVRKLIKKTEKAMESDNLLKSPQTLCSPQDRKPFRQIPNLPYSGVSTQTAELGIFAKRDSSFKNGSELNFTPLNSSKRPSQIRGYANMKVRSSLSKNQRDIKMKLAQQQSEGVGQVEEYRIRMHNSSMRKSQFTPLNKFNSNMTNNANRTEFRMSKPEMIHTISIDQFKPKNSDMDTINNQGNQNSVQAIKMEEMKFQARRFSSDQISGQSKRQDQRKNRNLSIALPGNHSFIARDSKSSIGSFLSSRKSAFPDHLQNSMVIVEKNQKNHDNISSSSGGVLSNLHISPQKMRHSVRKSMIQHNNTTPIPQFSDLIKLLRKQGTTPFNGSPTSNTTKDGSANQVRKSVTTRLGLSLKKQFIQLADFEQYDDLIRQIQQFQKLFDTLEKIKQLSVMKLDKNETIDLRKEKFLSECLNVMEQAKFTNEWWLLFTSRKLYGDVQLEFKDFHQAIKTFKRLKDFCDQNEKYKDKIRCYEQIGICYRLINDHQSAIKYFRKQLELAWEQKDDKGEVRACDNLALEFFYLGDLEKAAHFNDRMMRGKTELDSSIIKRVSTNNILSKRKHQKYEFMNNNRWSQGPQPKKESNNEMSFDCTLSKAYQLLPHFNIKDAGDINSGEVQLAKPTKEYSGEGPKFIFPDLQHLNNPPPYEYLPNSEWIEKQKKRRYFFSSARNTTRKQAQTKLDRSTHRDYVGAEHLRADSIGKENKAPNSSRFKTVQGQNKEEFPSGEHIYNQVLKRVKEEHKGDSLKRKGRQSCSSQKQKFENFNTTLSHQSLLRTMPKEQVQLAIVGEQLDKEIEGVKEMMKKMMLLNVKKHKLGAEFEELIFNIC